MGRLTGRAGVCLGTLGPGATNLVTGVADAYLDRAPLVALTGQGDLNRMHKESHQYIDVVSLMRPITKWNARVTDAAIVPEAVRKAFSLAQAEKPGATHLELPEDVMGIELGDAGGEGWAPLPVHPPVRPEPAAREMLRAADIIRGGSKVVALAGNGAVRGSAAGALREFCRATGVPVAETFMGKGLVAADSTEALGATGPAGRRLPDGGVRRCRCGGDHRLRPGRAVTDAVEPGLVTRRSCASTRCPPRSMATTRPRSSWWATSITSF